MNDAQRRATADVREMAIVGMGSWGLCVLERAVDRARQLERPLIIHVVEPGPLGGGVYAKDQPDYLVLNNPCGQLSLYALGGEGDDTPEHGVGLHEWATEWGYRWVGHECRVDPSGEPIGPGDYLPRRIMGEYLSWFYDMLIATSPGFVTVVWHDCAAEDIVPRDDGGEKVVLANGASLDVDHVVVTTGHTYNEESKSSGPARLRPYPVRHLDERFAPGSPVAIAGMGLVAFDLLTALTVGRGGSYERDGERLRYRPSGLEPRISIFSRSGAPYCAKSAHGIDPYGDYQPVVCTEEAFAELVHPGGQAARRQVDFRAEVLPLLYAEMEARYHTHAAFLKSGEDEARAVHAELVASWAAGGPEAFGEVTGALALAHGSFDPASHIFPEAERDYESSREYELAAYDLIEADLDEAMMPGGSPVKAALEVLRILRDRLRSVIEFQGLTYESYLDFQRNIRGRINRIEAGPPPLRSRQLLALMDAGVVHLPFGPNPEVADGPDGKVLIRSTRLENEIVATVDGVINGHLDLPTVVGTESPFLLRLRTAGRLVPMHYGNHAVGSVAIDTGCHPLDADGNVQSTLTLMGVLTEGARYFTHYLPSPRSRLRAVLDAQECVNRLLG